ncbi:synaptic vesicle 2-related protein-like [Bolinopsis microptera]|uniref:synaptic vesicle 2-related protein-like n=1 Tax=Bolinopsis microptera TaxID=2820187 RepID=UPI00307AB3AD
MATSTQESDKDELIESDHIEYGSTEDEIATKSLEEIYTMIGVGKAQYMYWTILAVICYVDGSEMVLISTIVPVIRCEWGLSIVWETLINVSAYFFSALGGGVFAKFPDIYGRKKMIAIALTLLFLTSSASAFAQTKEQFFILRCLSGVCMGITYPTCNSFTAEIVKSTHREVGPMLCSLFFNISVFLAAVLAYLSLNTLGWRWFVFVMAVPLLVCLVLLVCLLPESPRYLAVSGRKKEAMEALRRMAKVNGVSLPENLKIAVRSDQELGSISDILKSDYRKETILLSIMYFGNLLILFGTIVFVPLALYSGFCGGEGDPPVHKCVEVQQNSLLELSIVTFACVVSSFVGYGTSIIMGRSISLKIFATVSFITSIFLFKCFSNIVTVGLFFVIKFMQVSHNIVTLIIVPELYPTTFRNTAMGFINSWGKLGGVVGAGAVYALYYYSPMLVVVMFSGAALMVAVASWIWNKETKVTVIRDVGEDDSSNQSESW